MVNRRKNLISKLLCLTIFMSLVQTTVVFAEGTENSEVTTSVSQSSNVVKAVDSVVAPKTTGAAVDLNVSDFAFDSESGTITKYRGTDTTVVIPSTINGVSVKKIGIEAFRERKDITNISIQNGIESMEYYAFYGCSNLTSINIPESMKSIGDGAFGFCDSLTNVIIPNSVVSIGNHAFLGCRKLTNINIPNSVKNIGNYAFEECDSITSISIPEGVKSIGAGTFRSCNKLTSATLPNTITSIGYDAFYGCSNLIKMAIPSSVTNIEDEAFYGCSKLPSVIIPNGVTSIGSKVFYGCSSLPSMNIPSSVQSIGYDAFYACSGLKTMNIPNSVKSIGEGAFSFCDGLTSISIPNTITRIEAHTFLNCSKLTKIDIPINTTSIGNYAFEGCSGITTMNIPPTVKSLGDGIFRGCNKLTNIVLPKGVTSIGYDSFYGCSNLASVVIPSSVTSISKSAFSSKNTLFYVDSKGVSQLLLNNGIDPSKIILNNMPMAVKVASVGLNVTSLNWTVGKTGNFIATVLPINATNKAVTWKSSNPLVATVDANGKLIGISAGTTTITCTAADGSGKYATCAVTVARVATVKATSVGLNTNKLNWTVGQAGRFTATVLPANTTNKGLTWTTNNSKVATIDQNGNIKAVGVGTAVITCKANDGSNKSAICNVTVAAESKYLNVVSPLKDGFTYTFKGINVNFDNDVKVPLDWSKIKITDAKGAVVPIAKVNTTISKKEFQMYCPSMVNGQYKLYIPANTITDVSGKKYNKEIRIAFNVKLDTVVIDSKKLNVVSPLKDGFTYTFKGINVNFDNDVKVPLDWSKIKITDAKGAIVPIARVNTTISKKEFQMYCPSMVNGQYKLYIPANTITDVSGKKYNKEIRIAFNVKLDTVVIDSKNLNVVSPLKDGHTYIFKGINVNFDSDIKVPLDWSKIKITDAKGAIVPIAKVNTTISKKEFQMYCPSMVNGQYKLYIPANTITDISGKKYNKEIRIVFNVKLDGVVNDSKSLNVVFPIKDGFTYTFKGINVNFDNDVKVPLDWSKIKITDAKGAIVPIARVNTTMYKTEFQMYCPSMVNGQYKLYIPANTITDVSGKKYNKEIRIAFNVNVSKDTVAPQLGPVKYLTQMNNGKNLTSFTMKWTKATDNITLQNKLRYYLYQSEGKDYGNNISQWETNSKLLNKGGSLDIGSLNITGISNEKTYYFKLIVEDEAHNKTAYTTEDREASITKGVNKKALSDELYHAQEIAKFQVGNSLGQCSQSAMNELKKAISISQNVLNNNKATQAEVNNTVITLHQARYALSKTLITGLTSNTSSVLAKNNLDQTIQVQIVGCGDFIKNFNKNNIILGGDFKGLTIKSASIVDSSHTYKANISLSGNLKKYTGSGTITVNGDGWIGLNGKKNITCSINVNN